MPKRAVLHRIGEGFRVTVTCQLRRNVELTMGTFLRPLFVRVRRLRAFTAASLRKMLRMEANDGDFALQRMCPFCGLITPRYETCCLECGKAFKPA